MDIHFGIYLAGKAHATDCDKATYPFPRPAGEG